MIGNKSKVRKTNLREFTNLLCEQVSSPRFARDSHKLLENWHIWTKFSSCWTKFSSSSGLVYVQF